MSTTTNAINLTGGLPVDLAEGGTGQALTASAGGVVWSDSTKLNILAGTSTADQILLSGNAATPAWSTSTYPATNAANTLLYASSANVMAALATANSGVLITSASGVPSIATTLPSTVQGNITSLGIIASGVWNGTAVTVSYGGTGNTTFTAYSVICAGTTATGLFQNVSGLGSSGNVLTSNGAGALPTWQAASAGAVGATTTAVSQTAHGFSVGNVLTYSGTNDTYAAAKADSAADAEVVGIVSAVADANDFTLLTEGMITTLTGLTAGTTYWLSDSSAGSYTSTPPTTAGHINKPLMMAVDTTSAVFKNFRGEVIPSSSSSSVQGNNMIVNGNFQCFTLGGAIFGTGSSSLAVAASTTEYTFDRWQVLTNANQASAVIQEEVSGFPNTVRARIQRNSGQTGTGVYKFGTTLTNDMSVGAAGNILSLQFLVSTGANFSPTSGNLTVTVSIGTGNSQISNISSTFTTNTSILSQTIALGTSAAETMYSYQTSACASGTNQVSVVFSWTPTGTASTNDWVQFGNVQLEIGSTVNLFQEVNKARNLSDCQYFSIKNISQYTAPAQNVGGQQGVWTSPAAASTTMKYGIPYGRSLLQNGTVTLYSPANASAQVWDYKTTAACTSTSVGSNDDSGILITTTVDSGATAATAYYGITYYTTADIT